MKGARFCAHGRAARGRSIRNLFQCSSCGVATNTATQVPMRVHASNSCLGISGNRPDGSSCSRWFRGTYAHESERPQRKNAFPTLAVWTGGGSFRFGPAGTLDLPRPVPQPWHLFPGVHHQHHPSTWSWPGFGLGEIKLAAVVALWVSLASDGPGRGPHPAMTP